MHVKWSLTTNSALFLHFGKTERTPELSAGDLGFALTHQQKYRQSYTCFFAFLPADLVSIGKALIKFAFQNRLGGFSLPSTGGVAYSSNWFNGQTKPLWTTSDLITACRRTYRCFGNDNWWVFVRSADSNPFLQLAKTTRLPTEPTASFVLQHASALLSGWRSVRAPQRCTQNVRICRVNEVKQLSMGFILSELKSNLRDCALYIFEILEVFTMIHFHWGTFNVTSLEETLGS